MHVYSMCMLSERLQILVSPEQRLRLEREAGRRGTSIAGVVRAAVDAQLGGVTPSERRAALEDIRSMRGGRFASPDEVNRMVEQERDEALRVPPDR